MRPHEMARKQEDSELELTALQPAVDRKQHEPVPGHQHDYEKALITRVYWGLLPWMFITGLFTYFDRANFSFAAPALRHDLGLSNAAYGLASGILFAGYAALAIPSNLVISCVGAKVWLPVLTTAWGIIAAAQAAVKEEKALIALRFFLGAAEAGCFPGMWFHSTKFLRDSELTLAYAVILSSAVISQVVGAPLAAALLLMEGVCGLHGWQWLFIIEGAATCLWGIVLAVALAACPASAWFLSREQREWLQKRQDQEQARRQADLAKSGKAWAPLLSLRMWWLSFAWLLIGATITNIIVWTPLLLDAALSGTFNGQLQAHGVASADPRAEAWHNAKLALITSILYVPTAVAMIGVGWSSRRFEERRWHCFVPLVIAGIAFMFVPLGMTRGAISGFVLMIVSAVGTWAVYGPMVSWPNTLLHGRGAAVGLAFYNVLGAIGGFVSPYVVGRLSNGGSYNSSMYVQGAFNLAAALMVLAPSAWDIESIGMHRLGDWIEACLKEVVGCKIGI
ncbi:g3114 [Coccomyxa viridis]|uniref:G3114 protein n=1 Tax=Coccomyxa viridis TaxID=1274662 RepID=A0ABP1FQI8_9CHLO